MIDADPDDIVNLFKYDRHLQFAEKLGFIPDTVTSLPIESALALYPEVKEYGISFWMVEDLTPLLSDKRLQAHYLKKLTKEIVALNWSVYHKTMTMARNHQSLGEPHPLIILAHALLYVTDFHQNLGVRYYDPSIKREDYMMKLIAQLPPHMLPLLPDWLLGKSW